MRLETRARHAIPLLTAAALLAITTAIAAAQQGPAFQAETKPEISYSPSEAVPLQPMPEITKLLDEAFSLQAQQKFSDAIELAEKAKKQALTLHDMTGQARAERMAASNLELSQRFDEAAEVWLNSASSFERIPNGGPEEAEALAEAGAIFMRTHKDRALPLLQRVSGSPKRQRTINRWAH